MVKRKEKILFIEDDNAGRELGVFNIQEAGYRVDGAKNGEDGLGLFNKGNYDLVVTDVKMPGISGMEVLKIIKNKSSDVPVLVITAFGDLDMAVSAMRAGAYDFIGKPFNRDHLLITIEKALSLKQMGKELFNLRKQIKGVERNIIAKSDAMKRVLEITDKVAVSNATVLITGASGTGKELIARRIHARSGRSDNSFVAFNAAATPGGLLESELFGHVKGAFTGAVSNRTGRFKQADGGTLFLDEIAEMPMNLQSKLLRVLQEKTVDTVGSDNSTDVDVRIVAAANRNLPAEIKEGRFREDLYYRLNVFSIHVPLLNERKDDIIPMANYFLKRYSEGRELGLSKGVAKQLLCHSWPGNVRELENVCQRLAILATESDVNENDLPFNGSTVAGDKINDGGFENWPPLPSEGLSLIDLEKNVIERVLEAQGKNVSKAAVYLGVPRHVLAYRMQKYGIPR